jgi:transposase
MFDTFTPADLDGLDAAALKAIILAQGETQQAQQESYRAEIERLKLLIAKLQRLLFGTRSEKVLLILPQKVDTAAKLEELGEECQMSNVRRRVYPEAFKREAVERVGSSGLTASKVAAELGLHETVLRRWVRQLNAASIPEPAAQQRIHLATPSVADLAAEVSRLRKENERLRMEREILKKTVTIFGSGAR